MGARPPELVSPLLLMSAVTGLIDAVSVLGLGRVFTANMTGNVVFLGFAATGTPGFHFKPLLVALLLFLFGALVAGYSARALEHLTMRHWVVRHFAVEALLLFAAALLAIGYDSATLQPEVRLYAIIALTAVAMGFRNATVRHLKVVDMTTTVLTLTLTGLAADSSLAGGSNPNWQRRLASVVAILVGAGAGAWMVTQWSLAPPLFLATALIAAAAAMVAVRR
ncbi:membrane protein [Sphingomonas hengshuiensis]|uniref:Membrane protein n=1 Tax=Sphingomonas hengshuiensis TaxID=1609977 RepID=A0A7U5HVG4_9SPHN|nr:membrane protein [Sphingomonas hengshuiensis]